MNPESSRLLPLAHVPVPFVIDTSVVIEAMLGSFGRSRPGRQCLAMSFFGDLKARGRRGIMTPSSFAELLHVSIRFRYERELSDRSADLAGLYGTRISSWTQLYKREPSIVRNHVFELEQIRVALEGNQVIITSPDDLTPMPPGRSYDRELIRMIGRYGLDTSDCLILMEAERLGVKSIVTMDRDLLRARSGFTIHTWG